MKFSYLQTPLNKYTFKSSKIRTWVEGVVEGTVLNLFAGQTLLQCCEVRNDIRETMPADFHMDALELVREWDAELFDTILLDPPYSFRKSMEMYEGKKMSPFNQLKDALLPILRPRGIVVTFGYHSVVMGKIRGFEVEHICLMSHGGAIHDTIATVERRL